MLELAQLQHITCQKCAEATSQSCRASSQLEGALTRACRSIIGAYFQPAQQLHDEDIIIEECGGLLQASADVLHSSLQHNTLPDIPEFCKVPASTEFARDVIAYGRRLSFTTFAPLGWTQGLPLGHFRPPAPQDHQLHASMLSRHAGRFQTIGRLEMAAHSLSLHQPHEASKPGRFCMLWTHDFAAKPSLSK